MLHLHSTSRGPSPPATIPRLCYNGNPVVHKFRGSQRKAQHPTHQHTGFHRPTSFQWSTHYSWSSTFADEWVMGVKGMRGAAPHFNLADFQCPDCSKQHPLDLASCIAFCEEFRPFLNRRADHCGPTLAPPAHAWLRGNRTRCELRNIASRLVPTSLYKTLAPDGESSRLAKDVLPSRGKCLSARCKQACSHREQHSFLDPLPPPPHC